MQNPSRQRKTENHINNQKWDKEFSYGSTHYKNFKLN